jgi:hypothetical protein
MLIRKFLLSHGFQLVAHPVGSTHDLRNEIVEKLNQIRGTKAVQNGIVIPCGMKESAGERAKGAENEGKLGKRPREVSRSGKGIRGEGIRWPRSVELSRR